jgi:hypothetical protein
MKNEYSDIFESGDLVAIPNIWGDIQTDVDGKPFMARVVRQGRAGEFAIPCTLVNVLGVTRVFSNEELSLVAERLAGI